MGDAAAPRKEDEMACYTDTGRIMRCGKVFP